MGIELLGFTCGIFQAPLSFFLSDGSTRFIKVPGPAYLIRHSEKGLALFDTGLSHRWLRTVEDPLQAGTVGFDFREGEALAARLRAADIDPNEVRWIINSHLHPDHCGGNADFPNATVVLQRREKEVAFASEDGNRYYFRGDFDTGQPILAVDGEHDLFGDGAVVLMPTYGHSAGHQSARVRTDRGEFVLTADCCYLARNLDTLGVPAHNFDREASLEVLRRLKHMRDQGTRLLFGHDPDQWRGVPQGARIG